MSNDRCASPSFSRGSHPVELVERLRPFYSAARRLLFICFTRSPSTMVKVYPIEESGISACYPAVSIIREPASRNQVFVAAPKHCPSAVAGGLIAKRPISREHKLEDKIKTPCFYYYFHNNSLVSYFADRKKKQMQLSVLSSAKSQPLAPIRIHT